MGPGYERPRADLDHAKRVVQISQFLRSLQERRNCRTETRCLNRRAGGLVFPFRTEREGFEPSVPLRVHATSNRAPSAARSSLQVRSTFLLRRTRRGTERPPPDVRNLRREGDSNPRNPYGFNGFRDRPIQPLSHLSTAMRLRGFEPPTFRSAIWRSIQLSYSLARTFPVAVSRPLPSLLSSRGSVGSPGRRKEKSFRRGGNSVLVASILEAPRTRLAPPAAISRSPCLPPVGEGLGSNPPID